MSTHDFDGPAAAVQHAATGADSWRSAVHAQGPANPDHSDWYSISGEMVQTLRCLTAMALTLRQQVAQYGHNHVVRDDAGWEPRERLASAAGSAERLRGLLDEAERAANHLWSEIGHIAVEDWS